MPRLFFTAPARVKWVMLALAVLPCVPGMTFLIAGWARDPLWPAPHPPPTVQAEYERAATQARGLYRAGAAALGVGVLGGIVVGWKILRQREDDEDEDGE